MARGWITLDRKIQEHWLWHKEKPFDYRSAWIDLLLSVNHEERNIPFDGQIVTVKRGSTVTSIRKLSERWGWSNKKVSGFLNLLEQDKMLEQKRTTRCTTLTIVKYDNFQSLGNTKESLKKHSGNTQASLKHTNNNDITMSNNENKKDRSPSADENPIDYSHVERKWD